MHQQLAIRASLLFFSFLLKLLDGLAFIKNPPTCKKPTNPSPICIDSSKPYLFLFVLCATTCFLSPQSSSPHPIPNQDISFYTIPGAAINSNAHDTYISSLNKLSTNNLIYHTLVYLRFKYLFMVSHSVT